MSSPNTGPLVPPDLRSLFDSERRTSLVNCNKIQIGVIESYDAAKQSATVQLVNQRVVGNSPMVGSAIPPNPTVYPYPLLVDVPVWMFSGGSAFIGMPISKGDPCIVFFNDRDLDPWWTNGTTGAPPNSARIHSLADGMALVGVRPATTPLADLPTDGDHVTFGNKTVTVIEILEAMVATMSATIAACSSLDAVKTGGSAAPAIAEAQSQLDALSPLPGELFQ